MDASDAVAELCPGYIGQEAVGKIRALQFLLGCFVERLHAGEDLVTPLRSSACWCRLQCCFQPVHGGQGTILILLPGF